MRYAFRHDVDASVETGLWLNRRLSRRSLALVTVGAMLGVLGVLLRSWLLSAVAVVLIVEVVALYVLRIRRARERFCSMHASDAEVAFSARGVWSHDLGEATFPWSFFTGWTIRRGAILVLRQVQPQAAFIRVPIAAVPDDEWQTLTNLLWESLGPAGTPDSVRRYRRPRVGAAAEQ
jgi:hypothetical protein